MYELSRYLFRGLRPELAVDGTDPGGSARALLDLCEKAVARIAANPHAAEVHASHLFSQARWLFPVDRRRAVLELTDHLVDRVARELIGQQLPHGQMRCQAATHDRIQCRNLSMPGTLFCKRHQPHGRPDAASRRTPSRAMNATPARAARPG